ncbi:hypothetical protein BN134_1855 [Cronobacter dublinensis 1210]|uniref:Uncharacterized protein n=1 Tax=Cronobacter dublinensis 1210 TaxID=1208656 RepID=A0ABP1W6H6_9ENTR|nr:hypothetical protein BN134_1855 [Cronobacter dublinensis 1210]
MHHLDEFGGVGVEIDHVPRLFRRLGAGVHRHRHVRLRQRRGVVGAIAGHRHQPSFGLILADQRQFGLRRRFGEKIIHARFGRDGGGGQPVVAGDHHRFDAHFAKLREALFNAAFDDIFQRDNAEHLRAFGHHQRRAAGARHAFHQRVHLCRKLPAVGFHVATNGVYRAFTDHPVLDVNPAHARLGGKGYKRRLKTLHVALAQVKALLGEHHDAAAFRRFVGKRGELRGVRQRFFIDARRGQERGGLTVAKRDGAGFIKQQHVHIARRFYRAPAGGYHVRAQHPAHARHADGGEQPADGRRDETHQQRHQHRHADRRAAVQREGIEGRGRQQEDDGERHQQNGERDFVRRFTALGALDHRNHAVEERLAGVDAALDNQPVGENARAAGYRGEIAARFTDNRRRFARNGALVNRRAAFEHFAVARDNIAGFHQHDIAFAQVGGGNVIHLSVVGWCAQFTGERGLF